MRHFVFAVMLGVVSVLFAMAIVVGPTLKPTRTVEATASACISYVAPDGAFKARCNDGYPTDEYAAFINCQSWTGAIMANWGQWRTVAQGTQSIAYCPNGQRMVYKTILKR